MAPTVSPGTLDIDYSPAGSLAARFCHGLAAAWLQKARPASRCATRKTLGHSAAHCEHVTPNMFHVKRAINHPKKPRLFQFANHFRLCTTYRVRGMKCSDRFPRRFPPFAEVTAPATHPLRIPSRDPSHDPERPDRLHPHMALPAPYRRIRFCERRAEILPWAASGLYSLHRVHRWLYTAPRARLRKGRSARIDNLGANNVQVRKTTRPWARVPCFKPSSGRDKRRDNCRNHTGARFGRRIATPREGYPGLNVAS